MIKKILCVLSFITLAVTAFAAGSSEEGADNSLEGLSAPGVYPVTD